MVAELAGHLLPPTLLVRRLTVEGEPTEVVVDFDPRFGATAPRTSRRTARSRGRVLVRLAGRGARRRAWTLDRTGRAAGPCRSARATAHVACSRSPTATPLVYVEPRTAWAALEADERRWQQWSEDVADDVLHREMVLRSLLTLRLLTYSPSGAPVAAPTTSLPEVIGGVRNWDYRFAWPRDASIGVGAFLGVGKDSEARMFLAWLLHASRLDRPRLPVLLSLHGKHSRPERVLDGWPGYADSRPVRVGNGAADQHQLDTYGWVLDAAWLFTEAGHR